MKKQTNTKKFMLLALIIVIIGAFALYRFIDSDDSQAVFEGTIINLMENGDLTSMLVDGSFINTTAYQSELTVLDFTLLRDAEITKGKSKSSIADLAIGNHVRIKGPDAIRKSYPAQADVTHLDILAEESPNIMITGEVMEVLPGSGSTILTFLVEGNVTGYGENTEVYVTIPENAYCSFGISPGSGMLIPGDKVFVLIDGAMAESYPMQATASSVMLTETSQEDNN